MAVETPARFKTVAYECLATYVVRGKGNLSFSPIFLRYLLIFANTLCSLLAICTSVLWKGERIGNT